MAISSIFEVIFASSAPGLSVSSAYEALPVMVKLALEESSSLLPLSSMISPAFLTVPIKIIFLNLAPLAI